MSTPTFTVTDPSTGETVRTVEGHDDATAARLVDRAHEAFLGWRRTDFGTRRGLLERAAAILRERKDRYAELMAVEMGKPVVQGRGEVEKCAWVCDYYAAHGEGFLASEVTATDARESFVAYRPLGVVLAVMPWNFPLWQVFRFAAPALMAGNGGVLKHASNVPGCAMAIEEVLRDAGAPEGVFTTLLVRASQVEKLIDHRHVVAATLTGSTPAGRAIASQAGQRIKRTVLELGGSDPYVVLEDANLEQAVEACVTSRLINSGQSCIAAKRFIVHREVYDPFVEAVVEKMKAQVVGPALEEATQVGPQARVDLRDELHQQVTDSVAAGARLLLGGTPGPAAFYPPSVLVDIPREAPAYAEELFGPVASIFRAEDEADAIARANETAFGLGAAVFTEDLDRGRRIATEELEAGACFVNAFVRSDPRLPFGGVKESGYGRELAQHGIREFVNAKTVYVAD
jgi:succinate-semialdehyde dehydrogenase/glutarate-semialdehyde dehydrogenase